MATKTTQHSAEEIASMFVDQYYCILQRLLDQSHRFYKDNSMLSWPQSNGEIKSVTTSESIHEFIISSHFRDSKVEVTTVDSQFSAAGGVLVVVTGCLIRQDNSKRSFSQTFFLAPQEKGYYVLNDIFRFVGVEESPAVVEEEKVDEKIPVASSEPATLSKADVKKVSEKTKAKVKCDEEVDNKSSITLIEKEKSVVEKTSVVENVAPKMSYASMIKMGRPSPPKNAPNKTVRVVADAGVPSTAKKPQSDVKALISGSVSKAAAPSQENSSNDESQGKSIFIGGLPSNTTKSDLQTVVKQFGPVQIRDIQLKTYEDGYCCGFVHFQEAASAQNAVKAHHIVVNGKEAYVTFKRINKDRGGRSKSPSGGFHNDEHYRRGSESRGQPQSSDGHRA